MTFLQVSLQFETTLHVSTFVVFSTTTIETQFELIRNDE